MIDYIARYLLERVGVDASSQLFVQAARRANRLHPEPAFALLSRIRRRSPLPRGPIGTHSAVDLVRSAAPAVSRSMVRVDS